MKILRMLLMVFVCVTLVSCGRARQEDSFYGMSTYCSVTVYGGNGSGLDEAKKIILDCENEISAFISASAVSRVNRDGIGEISADFCELLKKCERVRLMTDGRYSVLSRNITSLWDFLSESPSVPHSGELKNAVDSCLGREIQFDGNTVFIPSDTGIEPGSVGKGFACHRAVEALKGKVDSAIVSVGGSIGAFGAPAGKDAFEIGVRDPFGSANDVIGVLKLNDGFVSTSGSYERFFEKDGKKFHHILDCTTGLPFDGQIVSATVVSDDGGVSDLLSTACFLSELSDAAELLNEFGCSGIFVLADGEILVSGELLNAFEPSDGRSVTSLD